MVVIRRVAIPAKPDDSNPDNKYDMIEVRFEIPTNEPQVTPVQARPYRFDEEGDPIEYATSCPHCGEGNFLVRDESLHCVDDMFFAGCTECKKGITEEVLPFEDPFFNPIKDNKISVDEMDPQLDSEVVDTSKTVAEKMSLVTPEAPKQEEVPEQDESHEAHEEAKEELPSDIGSLSNLDGDAQELLSMLDQANDEV